MHYPVWGLFVLGLGLAASGCGKAHRASGDPSSLAGEAGAAGAEDVAGSAGTSAGAGAQGGSGGSGGSGGVTSGAAAGTAGAAMLPQVVVPPPVALSKLDLLLMIDNSRDMLEKQRLLSDAVTSLLAELTVTVHDIHVGVISSSLGNHGADPTDVCGTASDDDHSRLIGALRPGIETWQNSGFLVWDPAQSATPPGLTSLPTFKDRASALVLAAGDTGCGFEASLEAWYRFLVDPEPPLTVVRNGAGFVTTVTGFDQAVLGQRQLFLRPDSVLAIVALSDENDCSAVDEGYGWLMFRTKQAMFGSTSACDANPNDPCCQSCGEVLVKQGCAPPGDDVACASGVFLNPPEDALNLRCWQQKRRFGLDLLQPLSRYVEGLTSQYVFDRAGVPVPNPLFTSGGSMRHPSQVIYTGIVGVPWQDLADTASLSGAGLTYLSAAELEQQGRWDLMLGDPAASPPVPPTDPFMLETPEERVGSHPLVPTAQLAPSTSTNPLANSINGHEQKNLDNSALQYACTFPLGAPLECSDALLAVDGNCRCFPADAPYSSPLCQPPGGGPIGITQYFAGAMPGTRHLQLMRELGGAAVPASACPKVVDEGSADYGYRPAMKALLPRLQAALEP